ncbi:MAG TPA: SdpI family protein [Gemmatimonadaceae bacterium]|nr:SdpI family protein [Gemmatimonadaceae bacterium]
MRKWYPWLLVALAAAFSAAVYGSLPERVPSHWNSEGVIDGYSDRKFAAWLMPGILIAMALILPRLPSIDPRRENFAKFRPTYDLVVNAIMTMIAVLHVAILGSALGWPISMDKLMPFMVGALLVLLGNVMPRARSNWWFGIRTPWTLSNERVWERTHRIGGVLFVIAGILLMLSALVFPSGAFPMVMVTVVGASVIPFAYSYFAWRQETRRATNP